ncbi:MAG: hypothetical protein HS132_16865 [Planctomycetia bacterium]|nr:hypothetical protein [Planctomycetia bacterium]
MANIVFQSCHHGVATEWVWMNHAHSRELHDYRYLGNTTPGAGTNKEEIQRWVARLECMPVLERQALLSAIGVIRAKKHFARGTFGFCS